MNAHHPTRGALRAALSLIGHSVKGQGKPEAWVERVLDHWHEEVSHLSADALTEAAKIWARTENFRPSLAQFLGLAELTGGGSLEDNRPKGCPDCEGTGWRMLCVHYKPARGWQRCDQLTACCSCPRGRVYARSVDGYTVIEAVADARRREGFIELYLTDRDTPVLPLAQRVSPHQWQVIEQSPRRKTFKMPDAL